MKILLIILSIIGLLKLVSLFVLFMSQLYYHIKGKQSIELHRDSLFYFSMANFYIIPTVKIYNSTYLEIEMYWLGIEYYQAYKMEFEDEPSSV